MHGPGGPWEAVEGGSCPPCSMELLHLRWRGGCETWPSNEEGKWQRESNKRSCFHGLLQNYGVALVQFLAIITKQVRLVDYKWEVNVYSVVSPRAGYMITYKITQSVLQCSQLLYLVSKYTTFQKVLHDVHYFLNFL